MPVFAGKTNPAPVRQVPFHRNRALLQPMINHQSGTTLLLCNQYVYFDPISTKNQYFFIFVSRFSKIGSTRVQEFPGFVGAFTVFDSAKTQDFFIFVGTPTCFFSYGITEKGNVSGTAPTKTFH